MKKPKLFITPITFSVVWFLSITVTQQALSEPKPPANAQALLAEAKKDEFDRKMAAKQTELDRLGEDLKKTKDERDDLEKAVAKVAAAAAETTGQLDQLAIEKKRLTQDLTLTDLRIDAEKLKAEGLKLLAFAQEKSREALAKQSEEISLRTNMVAEKIRQLSGESSTEATASNEKAKSSKSPTGLTESQKRMAKAEQATATAAYNARVAMEAATLKLHQAEAAAAKAEKKRSEIALEGNPSLPGGNDPLNPAKP